MAYKKKKGWYRIGSFLCFCFLCLISLLFLYVQAVCCAVVWVHRVNYGCEFRARWRWEMGRKRVSEERKREKKLFVFRGRSCFCFFSYLFLFCFIFWLVVSVILGFTFFFFCSPLCSRNSNFTCSLAHFTNFSFLFFLSGRCGCIVAHVHI